MAQTLPDNAVDLKHARGIIRKTCNGEGAGDAQGKPGLVCPLPYLRSRLTEDCSLARLSPYGHVRFPIYCRPIGSKKGKYGDIEASQRERKNRKLRDT